MTASEDPHRRDRPGEWRTPWARQAWRDTAQVLSGLPIAVFSAASITAMLLLVAGLFWTVLPALMLLLALLTWSRRLSEWQRSRISAFASGKPLPPPLPPLPTTGGPLTRLRDTLTRPNTWMQLAYHLITPLVTGAGAAVVTMTWAAAVTMTTAPLWSPWGPDKLAVVCGGGVVACFAAPWVAHWAAGADVALARLLLRPSRSELLARRVDRLTASRSDVVAAADAERRRIERDLHDGAQQRLVSLAMNLGMARVTLGDDVPEPARQAIAQAHDEAKQAVKELRDLVRGLNPAILDEQGLDAALSGLASRSPVPVRLNVDMARRVAPAVEAVAFFVVSEALTNVAKHAQATHAEVHVTRRDDRLRLLVTDDGVGGAGVDVGGGSGLRGLARRVGSVDGTLRVDSPVGGPTTVSVELPCV